MLPHFRSDLLFNIPTLISRMTPYLTLYPGYAIWMGTDGASTSSKAGDVVDIEITGLGRPT